MTAPWHCLPPADALRSLGSRPEGLSDQEADRRLKLHGPNAFRTAKPASAWVVLAAQLRSSLVLLLVGAGLIAAATGDRGDVAAIGAVLVLNVAIGFTTELRAHRAMEALLGLEVQRARVVREGRSRDVDARELVPGDIVLLEAGQNVPADARLLESAELRTVEASLTGEAGSVSKSATTTADPDTPVGDRHMMVYKSTGVVAGTARALVVATGMTTEVGRIGELAGRTLKGRAPLERRLEALGRRLAVVAVAVAVLIVVLGAGQGVPLGRLLQTAIALAVAAVPEGLPVVGTIAMAVGVRRMARRRALVRRLPVVETLGSATVICTDKTGTLTAGEMTATELCLADRDVAVAGTGFAAEGAFREAGVLIDPAADSVLVHALRIGALSNAAELHRRDGEWHPVGDPTDIAFLVLARKAGMEREQLLTDWPEIRRLPFSSERMLMATFHFHDRGVVALVKGAPRAVIERCDRMATATGVRPLAPGEQALLLDRAQRLAGRGLRVLALASKDVGSPDEALTGLTWAALAGLSDPPAPGVAETVRGFTLAGIRTVMITGDHRLTAASIGRELGLLNADDEVLEGRDIERLSDAELDQLLPRVGAFGRVSPEAKLRIITAFQRGGAIVAMLGDGVNDAAALRKADIGVAMGGRGTDLAKEAADVILEDDRFPTIGAAIEEGRVILENVRKFVAYLVACNVGEILVLLGASLAGHPAALAPLQILWINLLTDTFPALALAVEPGEPGIMTKPPPDPRAAILSRDQLWSTTGYALLLALATLSAFAWGLRQGGAAGASTLAFMTLAFAQIFHLGNARSVGPVLSIHRALGNRYALGAAALATGLQLAAAFWPALRQSLHVTPLSTTDWLVVGALALLPALVGQTIKVCRSARMRRALVVVGLALLSSRPAIAQDTVGLQLRTMIAQAHHPWARRPDFPRYVDVVARLYASRGDAPLWLAGRAPSPAARAAIAELLAGAGQGLMPADYDAPTLQGLLQGLPHASWNALALARFDLLLTVDLVRYLDDLRGGRVRPGPFGQGRAPPGLDLAAGIVNAIAGDSLAALVSALQPQLAQYRNLRTHLSRYQRLAAGPFVPLPVGPAGQPGKAYAGAEMLRNRLVALGDLARDTMSPADRVYAGPLVGAVRRFQARHNLAPDGVIGGATLAALNVPYAARLRQIELALERLRALPFLGRQRFIVVNIPAFQLFAFDSVGGTGAPSLQMKVVTGKALDTRTPLLYAELRYVEFRPYWTVPRSILVKELLPILGRRPRYLRDNQMEIVGPREAALGDTVTTDVLRRLRTGELSVRQRPGPRNALGLAKFVFPNAANIYMHGTPQTELFSRTRRDFSHGCIRLEDPAGLAAWVLQDQPAWGREAIESAMAATASRRALLTRPMPVVVFYTTAVAAPDGTIRFYDDVYGHDRELVEALRAAAEAP